MAKRQRIILKRDNVTHRWCIIDRVDGFVVLETFSDRNQAIEALYAHRSGAR